MSEREDSNEECAAGLTVHNEDVKSENVNPAPSYPNEESSKGNECYSQHGGTYATAMSSTEGSPRHARTHAFPMAHPLPTPSSVTSLPSVYSAACCPSPAPQPAVDQCRFPDVGIGINVRGPNPSSFFGPSLMMQSGLSLRPLTTSTPSDCATAAQGKKGKKDSSEKASELCDALEGTSLDTLEPLNAYATGELQQGAMSSAAADGIAIQFSDHPNNCDTTESEDKLDDAKDVDDYEDDDDYEGGDYEADDDEDADDETDVVLLQESFLGNAGISIVLAQSSASAVDLSSVQEDGGDLGLFPSEHYAMGLEHDCHGCRGKVKFDDCNPLHCDPSPGSQSCVQFDAGSLNTLGSNFPDPLHSAQLNAAAGGEAEPPDTGQSAEDDDDRQWATCKICLQRYWKLIFLPCGHGCCRHCYRLLNNRKCPFCRKHIIQIKEVLLAYNSEDI